LLFIYECSSQQTIQNSDFKVGVDAAQAELGLRLLVSYDHSDTSNQDYLSWAIDHGFEYIEIFGDRLMESKLKRYRRYVFIW
jgi:hypothetical protein